MKTTSNRRKDPNADAQAVRLMSMARFMAKNPQGVSVIELAQEYNVSRYTIYRDLARIEDLVPVQEMNGRYYVNLEDCLETVSFTLDEAIALYLTARMLATRIDKRNPQAASALDKLSTAIEGIAPTVSRQMAATARQLNSADQWNDEQYARILKNLGLAWAQRHKVRLVYRAEKDDSTKTYTFYPYFLEPYATGQSIYVIGLIEPENQYRNFKIDRIAEVETLPETFELPEDAGPQNLLKDAWGIWFTPGQPQKIVLRFSPRVAKRVRESRWHLSQQLSTGADGSLLWSAHIAAPKEMIYWILGWGAEVEVIEPESLRTLIREEIQAMGQMYPTA